MSDTPRTDKAAWPPKTLADFPVVPAQFARELERELAEANEEILRLREERDARRHSLAQEIAECLRSRGHFAPRATDASDLIGAVGRALDEGAAELLRAVYIARGTFARQLDKDGMGPDWWGDDEHEAFAVLKAAIARAEGKT